MTILFAAVVFEFLSVYLWNLWLAPYLVIEEHITKMILIPANPSQVPAADGLRAERHETSPSAWKTVPAFKIWAAPDLSVGVAPGAAESRPTDRTRAMLVRLVGAVRSGKLRLLRGIPRRDMKHSKVAQEELLRDFAEDANGDASEFLK